MIEKLNERLFNLRREKGVTQKEVAQYAAITPAALSAYEKGIKMPQLETAVKLAEYYGVSLDFICGLKERDKGGCDEKRSLSSFLRFITSFIERTNSVSVRTEREGFAEASQRFIIDIRVYTKCRNAYDFFEKYNTLLNLRKSGDIDTEVLEAWKTKRYQENEDKTIDGDILISDDGELPF